MNLWREAKKHLAGGVSSPVRAFKAVGGEPVFMRRSLGPYLFDSGGKAYVDYCLSWGALLLGHADDEVAEAIAKQAVLGTSFGTVTSLETELAQEIQKAFPRMERIRFTSSGTEAVMSAVRLARGFTGRKKILKFEGCYHGHSDSLLVKAGSGLATFGTPNSAGVPEELARLTAVLPYNDVKALKNFFKTNRDLACVLVEPVAANMGLVPASPEFLRTLREQTRRTGTLLVFDEVVTGFRLTYGGAQHLYGIQPDLTALGKIIGGGLPIGAFGGNRQIMAHLSPEGRVYQAGTLSGNPISMVAGKATLARLSPDFYKTLKARTAQFFKKIQKVGRQKGFSFQQTGSMFTLFFRKGLPKNFKEANACDTRSFARLFHQMLKNGVYFPPSQFETSFVSAAHTDTEFDKTIFYLHK